MGEDAAPMSEIIFYPTEDGRGRVQVGLQDSRAWRSQRQLAEGFEKDVRTLREQIQTTFGEEEREPEATIRKFRVVRREGPLASAKPGAS